ncbi:MAG TPA: zf-HC2 domain-containing protein [Vicinamibacteria bacterium]|nr:zf-HC2 domain-containing protein [Vicinamibacteria bacterium]
MTGHVVEQLSAFLDGELDERERSEVARHLEACPECARHLDDLLAVDRLARGVEVAAPAGYFDGFASRVRDRIRKRPRRLVAPVWAWAAAASLLLAVTVPRLMRDRPAAMPPAAAPAALPPPTTLAAAPAALEGELSESPRELGDAGQGKRDDARQGRAANLAPAKKAKEFKDEATAATPVPGPPPAAQAPAAPPAAERPLASAVAPEREVGALAAPEAAERDALYQERGKRQEGAGAEEQAAASGFAGAPAAVPESAEAPRLALQKTAPSAAFRALLERKAATIAEARGLREAWRAFAGGAVGAEADEARVRVIEAGREAYRLSGERADLDQLRRDAAAYLKREDAHQADRVRALLRGLPR